MEEVILLVGSCLYTIAGIVLVASEKFADLFLSKTSFGRRWMWFYGEQKAKVRLRYVAGPIVVICGILWVVVSVFLISYN